MVHESGEQFVPDYRHMVDVAYNWRPERLPLYEHYINPAFMEQATGTRFEELAGGDDRDLARFFAVYCGFYRDMTYDTVSYEVGIVDILPGGGALLGEHPGPIQNRADFERYPWEESPARFWAVAERRFQALAAALPPGMKALGGPGYGVFEIAEDLAGYEHLAYMSFDDPELYADLYRQIGDLMVTIWRKFSCNSTRISSPSAASATTRATRSAHWLLRGLSVRILYLSIESSLRSCTQRGVPSCELLREHFQHYGRHDRRRHRREALQRRCDCALRYLDRAVRRSDRPRRRHRR